MCCVDATTSSSRDHGPIVLRVREANEEWARYITALIDNSFDGKQSDLAEALGVAPSTVTRWLDGATPSIKHLRNMREQLGIPMTNLLIAAGALTEDDDVQIPAPSPAEAQALITVAEAILSDHDLIVEAREHLLNQYNLLKRIVPAETSQVRGKQIPRRTPIPSDAPPLRAVADRGDPADRAEMERRAREVRRRHPRRDTGTAGDEK